MPEVSAPFEPGLYKVTLHGIDRPEDWYEVTVALGPDRMVLPIDRCPYPFHGMWDGTKYTGFIEPPYPYDRLSRSVWVDCDSTEWPTVDEFLGSPVHLNGQSALWEDGLQTPSFMFRVVAIEPIVLFQVKESI